MQDEHAERASTITVSVIVQTLICHACTLLLQAILAFLKSTGLSAEDVLGQEPLCDALLRYHVLPYEMTSSMIVKKDSLAQTLEPRSYLTANKGPRGVTVQDMQGHVAKVTKGDLKIGEATIHTVDRVLLSGE